MNDLKQNEAPITQRGTNLRVLYGPFTYFEHEKRRVIADPALQIADRSGGMPR